MKENQIRSPEIRKTEKSHEDPEKIFLSSSASVAKPAGAEHHVRARRLPMF